MSIWTHVAATIRFDGLRFFGGVDEMEPDLGKTVTYHSEREAWDSCDVPCGSEGSVQTSLWVNPDKSCAAAYTATIWGDLRDYENVGEIIDYLERITKAKMVRNGIATIEVEGRDAVVMHYQNEKWRTMGAEPAVIPTRESDNRKENCESL